MNRYVRTGGHRGVVHRAGQSLRKWLRRELPQSLARRVPGRRSVREPDISSSADDRLESGLQPVSSQGLLDPLPVRRCVWCWSVGVAGSEAAHANPRSINRSPTHTFISPGTENQGWSMGGCLAMPVENREARASAQAVEQDSATWDPRRVPSACRVRTDLPLRPV